MINVANESRAVVWDLQIVRAVETALEEGDWLSEMIIDSQGAIHVGDGALNEDGELGRGAGLQRGRNATTGVLNTDFDHSYLANASSVLPRRKLFGGSPFDHLQVPVHDLRDWTVRNQ